MRLDLAQVVYVRAESDEPRVGFGWPERAAWRWRAARTESRRAAAAPGAHAAGTRPARERAVARFSRSGEHGGVWLAIGVAGAALRPAARRGRWRRATGDGRAARTSLNTAIKLARAPPPAAACRACRR